MTINRGLWVPINTGNVGTTEVEARLADNALFESNNGADARSGLLSPATTTIVTGKANMSFDIAACNPVTNRVAGEGVYRFAATGVTNVETTAAPSSNSRIDVIWVKQNDQSKGDANNLAVAGVTQGTVAASPVAPAIPAGALELARATVGANITATTAASITQTFRYTSLKGAPTPVRSVTERAEITAPRAGQRVARLDLDASGLYEEIWLGTAWASAKPSEGVLSFSTATGNSGSIGAGFVVVSNAVGIQFRAGRRYRIRWTMQYQMAAANQGANVLIALANNTDPAGDTTGLTQLQGRVIRATVASADTAFEVEAIYKPTVDEVKQVKWVANSPSTSLVFVRTATNPDYFYIEDVGGWS